MIIYLDFDGTVVEHEYPTIGLPVPNAMEVILKLQSKGHEIILNTYRANMGGSALILALEYVNNHCEIVLKPIIATNEKIYPTMFMDDRDKIIIYKKPSGSEYIFIDDSQAHIPLIDSVFARGKMVSWKHVELKLIDAGIL